MKVMKNIRLVLCVWLSIIQILCVFTGCQNSMDFPDDSVTSWEDTSETFPVTNESVTELETYPSQIWEDYIAPNGANITDLTISNTVNGGTQLEKLTYRYENGNSAFDLLDADYDGKTITLRSKYVSVVRFNQQFMDGSTTTYQMKMHITGKNEIATWNTQYFGLRLNHSSIDATGKTGVWIALRENEIGLRTNAWPETTFMTMETPGVNFTTARMLYIEDDMEKDVITIMADDDSGKKVMIAVVKLVGDTVNMYQPDAETPSITDSGVSIPETGYFSCWLHHMVNGPVYIEDLQISGYMKGTAKQANMLNSLDVMADTWIAVDDLDRVTGTNNSTVSDKKVGIFYFLWHDPTFPGSVSELYDHSLTYYTEGLEGLKYVMTQGPIGHAHYWAEPYFGYYRSDDEWVIRKHTYQLVAAGIDFVFIDATNGHTYENTYETILRVWSEMRAEGHKTPQICFHCGDVEANASKSFSSLWMNLYSTGRYEELWFKHDGKPLIFLPQNFYKTLSNEQKDFFTVRYSWASSKQPWYTSVRGRNCWPWADMYPQGKGMDAQGHFEQMVVMSGFWSLSYDTFSGRSYSAKNGGQPQSGNMGFDLVDNGTSGMGIGFEEQFSYAIECDPDIIMLVGWNEWWAGRWEAGAAVGQTQCNNHVITDNNDWTRHYYVDTFNPEFSRDIEPVKGLYNDNYYYQMTMNIRKYKGSRQNLAAFGQRPINIDGEKSQWDIVGPEYRDYEGDIIHRDATSYVGNFHYKNDSGRNDFTVAKVSMNGHDLVFYAECVSDITQPTGTNWMNLFINADCDYETGWYGYDYVLNRTQSDNTCSVMKFLNNSWDMEPVGSAVYTVRGNCIQIKVDKNLLGINSTFDFKWADNSVDSGDIMQFIDMGDAAPNDRFNYRYTTIEPEIVMPDELAEDMIVLKAGSYYAYANGQMVRLDETSTRAVFLGDNEHLYVPLNFAKDVMNLTISGETYNHFGIRYVDIADALMTSGKTVTCTEDMVVIANGTVTEEVLLTLYRALY